MREKNVWKGRNSLSGRFPAWPPKAHTVHLIRCLAWGFRVGRNDTSEPKADVGKWIPFLNGNPRLLGKNVRKPRNSKLQLQSRLSR